MFDLVRRGYRVLLPFGVNQRYDLVLDVDGKFVRAQCKTGRLRDGVVRFATRSVQSNTRGSSKRGYVGEVDIFLVHCPQNRRTYAVPVEQAPADHMYLRVRPTANGQAHGIHWANEFELPG